MIESFGVKDAKELDAEYRKLMSEDRIYFDAADTDKDGLLSYEEFQAFHNPEHYVSRKETTTKRLL